MKIKSIRFQLPFSYAVIALLTTLVLGSVLLFTLQRFYNKQEYNYLSTNADLMISGIAKVIEEEQGITTLPIYVQNLSYLIQARIRVLDSSNIVLADSGELQSQQFIFTNLSPEGMNAEILREGRTDRYLFHASINVIDQPIQEDALIDNPVFLAQVPLQPALFGVEPGTQGAKEIKHTDQKVSVSIVGSSGEVLGTLEVSEGLSFSGDIIRNVTQAWGLASMVAVVISALIGLLVSNRFTAPVTELTKVTQNMAAGNFSSRAMIHSQDEFYSLGQSFNSMAEKLEDLIVTLQNFVADAAHELLTPVAALRMNIELAQDDQNYQEFLREAEQQAIRLQAIVEGMLDLSKIEAASTQFKPVSLKNMFKNLEKIWSLLASRKNIKLQIILPEKDVYILGNEVQIIRAVENILDNAVKFSEQGGEIILGAKEENESVLIYVKDDGIGIPEKEQARVFQRFFRGRNTAAYPGNGLGLAIVKAIIDYHGGQVVLGSDEPGTTISLYFPIIKNDL